MTERGPLTILHKLGSERPVLGRAAPPVNDRLEGAKQPLTPMQPTGG